jgi:hypothetical protein
MKPVELQNPDVVLLPPPDMPECGTLTAVKFDEGGSRGFVSVWQPSPDELRALVQGGCVTLAIVGTGHPPVAVGVQDAQGNLVE